jgi:hypothetical protein
MMIFAGMLGVSAMGVQNALVRISLRGAPSTAVMTTNVTVFTIDVGEISLRRDMSGAASARDRAAHTWPAIAGFLLGCALGAAFESAFSLRSLALPAGLALLALALGVSAKLHDVNGSAAPKPRQFRMLSWPGNSATKKGESECQKNSTATTPRRCRPAARGLDISASPRFEVLTPAQLGWSQLSRRFRFVTRAGGAEEAAPER